MKTRILYLALVVFCCSEIWAQYCVIHSSSLYQIVIPDEYPANKGVERWLKSAAELLKHGMFETVGLNAEVCKESAVKQGGHCIYLGNTNAIHKIGIDPSSFLDYNGIIIEKNGNIYIAGNDHHRFNRENPDSSPYQYVLGTVKALVVFMEEYMKTRFVLPGEAGIDFMKRDQISIPVNLRQNVKPLLFYATGRNSEFFYDYANNNFGRNALHTYGGHSYYSACPEVKYAKEHPEYFAEISGKRNGTGGHLCISNPEVQELIYQEALKKLDAGATTVQIAQTDGYIPCQCSNCIAFGNTYDEGEKIWILHRMFAERLMKDRPGKSLHLLCYPPNNHAPKSFKEFPDNVIIELCRYTDSVFDEWKDIKVKLGFTAYIYNWGWYQPVGITPKTTPEYVAKQVQKFHANNIRGIYRCGFGELFGLEGPVYYVYGKMWDNPAQNYMDIEKEYYLRTFREASGPMQAFYRMLYRRLQQIYIGPVSEASGSGSSNEKLPARRIVTLGAIYSPELVSAMEMNLENAEKAASSEKVKARLKLVRNEFEYIKNLSACIALYNAYLTIPNESNFKELADKVIERNKLIDSYYSNNGRMFTYEDFGRIVHFGGIDKKALMVNGRLGAPMAAPFTWNVENMLKNNILPGTNCKSMVVKRAQGKIGDDAEKDAWSHAEWQYLGGVQLNDTWCDGMFKVIYDSRNMYFAFDTQVKPGQKYQECGKDGDAWHQDCIEIMLDTAAERQRYYHFIINPVKNSFFDARFGYIDDPLHPKYREADESWDGAWSYKGQVEGRRWKAFITIPFSTLGVTPAPSSHWCMNIGKEAYTPATTADSHGRLRGELELMLWSPNMEYIGFQTPEALGNIVFQ